MSNGNIEKIYSRKRFILRSDSQRKVNDKNSLKDVLPQTKIKKETNKNEKKIKKKIIKIVVLIIMQILMLRTIYYYYEPIFATLCEEKAKSIATIITNQQSTLIMNKYQYDQLYTIERDENTNIIMVKANVVPINNLISDLTENIQHEFDDIKDAKIEVTLGNLSGIYFLSGFGPEIPIDISIGGTVETDIKSEFIAQGVNQTLHRVYVEFNCEMKIVTPLKNYTQKIANQVIIAEYLIVGNIPNAVFGTFGTGS